MKKPIFGKDFPVLRQIYKDQAGGWRYRLYARNGAVLAVSSESYTRRMDAQRAWVTLKDGIKRMT